MRRSILLSLVSATVLSLALLPGHVGATTAPAGGKLAVQDADPDSAQLSGLVAISEPFLAGKGFATTTRSWLELLFLDGTSTAIGPESALTIDSYAYDVTAGSVELRAHLGPGVYRVVSGRVSGQPIILMAGSKQVEILDGAALVEVAGDGTISATLLWGRQLALTSGGETMVVKRPGFETTAGTTPSSPTRLSADILQQKTARLMPARGETVTAIALDPEAGGEATSEAQFVSAPLTDQDAGSQPTSGKPDDTLIQQAAVDEGTPTPPSGGSFSIDYGNGLGGNVDPEVAPVLATDSYQNTGPIAGGAQVINVPAGTTTSLPQSLDATTYLTTEQTSLREEEKVFGLRMKLYPESSSALLIEPSEEGDPVVRDKLYRDVRDVHMFEVLPGEASRADESSVGNFYDASANAILHEFDGTPMIGVTDNFRPQALGEPFDEDGNIVLAPVAGYGATFFQINVADSLGSEIDLTDFNVPTVTHAELGQVPDGVFLGDTLFVSILDVVPVPTDINSNGYDLGLLDTSKPAFMVFDATLKDAQGPDLPFISNRAFVFGGLEVDRSDASNPDELPGTGGVHTVTRYALSDGLQGFEPGFRLEQQYQEVPGAFAAHDAFRREETFAAGAPRGDTELLIVTPDSGANGQNVFLRADLQIAPNGQGNASLATGTVEALGDDGPLVLSGGMVGSTRESTTVGSTHLTSSIGSVGTGFRPDDPHMFGGNTFDNDFNASGEADPGRIGYFVVSQDDPLTSPFAPGADTSNPELFNANRIESATEITPCNAGTDCQDGVETVEYAFTRFAIGIAQDEHAVSDFGNRSNTPLTGFATGIVESSSGGEALSLYSLTGGPEQISIMPNQDTNRLSASFDLQGKEIGGSAAIAANDVSLVFGQGEGESAYVTDGVFGARLHSGTADAGFVVAPEFLAEGVSGDLCDCRYAQWGVWFGDVLVNGGRRDHVNLGYLVVGRQTAVDSIGMTGSASYGGHALGTVYDARGIRDVAGSFENTWNFGTRTGQFQLDFDGSQYSGPISQPAINARDTFSGTIDAIERTGTIDGAFFGPAAGGVPPEVGGTFAIQETPGAATYRADGVFAGNLQ